MKDSDKVVIGEMLMESCVDSTAPEGVSEMAWTIIDTFPEFKSFNIEIFNKKAGSVSFETALRRMQDSVSFDVGPEGLNTAFKEYKLVYDHQVNQIVQGISSFSEKDILTKIDEIAVVLKPHRAQLGCKSREFGEFLGYLCSLWTYHAAKSHTLESLCEEKKLKFVQQPHATQILGIFRLLGLDQKELANHLIQINTGEAKVHRTGLYRSCLSKVRISCESSLLQSLLIREGCPGICLSFQDTSSERYILF